MGFERILVGVDGSEASLRALRLGVEIAARFGAKVTLVTVIPPLLLPNDAYAPGVGAIEQEHRRHAEQVLAEASELLEPKVEVDKVQLFGAPAESLAQLAQSDEVGMVVVGSRGRNAVMRVLVGSVSDRLVHISPKPVLIVH